MTFCSMRLDDDSRFQSPGGGHRHSMKATHHRCCITRAPHRIYAHKGRSIKFYCVPPERKCSYCCLEIGEHAEHNQVVS